MLSSINFYFMILHRLDFKTLKLCKKIYIPYYLWSVCKLKKKFIYMVLKNYNIKKNNVKIDQTLIFLISFQIFRYLGINAVIILFNLHFFHEYFSGIFTNNLPI